MREYGQVQCAIWGHPDAIALNDQSKVLMLYLLTGPHSNGLGCYRLPAAYVHADLGWPIETVEIAFDALENGPIKFCRRCTASHFVFIDNYLRWNPIANGKVAIARQREFREIPSSFTLFPSLSKAMLTHGKHWSAPFEIQLREAVGS